MKIVNRRRMNDESGHNVWRSYSDMMSGLLLLFVLIMAVCLMQAQKNYNDKLAEQATRLQTQDALEQTQVELNQRESEIEAQSLTLTDLQTALEAQAAQLKSQEDELEAAKQQLLQQESELAARNEELTSRDAALAAKDAELAARDELLASSQAQLDDRNQQLAASQELLDQQQARIDQIIGVKANLIASLRQEFEAKDIGVSIDSQTGAIVLQSNVLFDYNEAELKDEGIEILAQALPTYCSVLLSPEYVDYVAEVIIDGYTDSTGGYMSNLELSQNRARAVAEYLLYISGSFLSEEQSQELSEKLTTNGRSSSNLVLDENGMEDANASRRVEIKFRLKDEEMIQELSQLLSNEAEVVAEANP